MPDNSSALKFRSCSSELLDPKKYRHIYSLNGFKVPDRDGFSFRKYMSLERFVNSVANQELTFVSPELWKDPFETRFLHTDFSSKSFTRPDVACLCLTTESIRNEEASWKIYSDDKSIRASIDPDQLFSILETFSKKHDCKVYIGEAIYDLGKKDIDEMHLAKSKYHSVFFPGSGMNIEHYLSLLLLKRKAYCYENEVRFFLVQNKGNLLNSNKTCIVSGVDYNSLLCRVVLSPYEPLPKEGAYRDLVKERNKMEELYYKEKLGNMLKCKVLQSCLYSYRRPLKELKY